MSKRFSTDSMIETVTDNLRACWPLRRTHRDYRNAVLAEVSNLRRLRAFKKKGGN